MSSRHRLQSKIIIALSFSSIAAPSIAKSSLQKIGDFSPASVSRPLPAQTARPPVCQLPTSDPIRRRALVTMPRTP